MDRRAFIRNSTGAAIGGLSVAGCMKQVVTDSARAVPIAGAGALPTIGVQLYTVRSLMAKDVPGTLAGVASVGYDEVEFHDYFGHSPQEIRTILDDVGLVSPARHFSLQDSRERLGEIIEAAHTIGHKYLVVPWLAEEDRVSLDRYRQLADHFNQVAETCREANIQFAYHNHEFEFITIDGKLPFDILLDETDPSLVDFEIDLFWITYAGMDPLPFFEKYPGRFTLCHVKDADASMKQVSVGKGAIDYPKILGRSEQAGFRHFFVETDNPDDPMENITSSYQYLRALRL